LNTSHKNQRSGVFLITLLIVWLSLVTPSSFLICSGSRRLL
jgi:hypothetical protein